MSKTDDLSNVKPGDRLFYDGHFGDVGIVTVHRVTDTQIIIRKKKSTSDEFYEMRFRKLNGRLVGSDTWGASYLSPLTPEKENRFYMAIAKQKAQQIIKEINLPNDLESIKQIVSLLEQIKKLSAKS